MFNLAIFFVIGITFSTAEMLSTYKDSDIQKYPEQLIWEYSLDSVNGEQVTLYFSSPVKITKFKIYQNVANEWHEIAMWEKLNGVNVDLYWVRLNQPLHDLVVVAETSESHGIIRSSIRDFNESRKMTTPGLLVWIWRRYARFILIAGISSGVVLVIICVLSWYYHQSPTNAAIRQDPSVVVNTV